MLQGVIKRLVRDRGFGFISGNGGEVYFHMSTVTGISFNLLHEGQQVRYSASDGPNGLRADVVTLA